MDDEQIRVWWKLLLDLSIGAAQPFYPAMGLVRSDRAFSDWLRQEFQTMRFPLISDDGSAEFVASALRHAASLGADYVPRLRDWAAAIHSPDDRRQRNVFWWQLLVHRVGVTNHVAPQLVLDMARVLDSFPDLDVEASAPANEWDEHYFEEAALEGLPALLWVDTAVSIYRLGYAWEAANRHATAEDRLAALRWGKTEAPEMQLDPGWIVSLEQCLGLPLSLRPPPGEPPTVA